MNDLPIPEYYPSEIHRLLNIGENLTVGGKAAEKAPEGLPRPVEQEAVEEQPELLHVSIKTDRSLLANLLRSSFVFYPIIFIAAFLFFYSALNFPALVSQVQGWFAPPEDEQILGEDLSEYYAWMGGYYFAVGNRQALEPTEDIDRDGLSNLDEFLVRTNPIVADSDNDGMTDGVEVLNGTNFWGEGAVTDKQSKLAAALDLIKISNRLSFNVATNFMPATAPNVLGSTKISYDVNKEGRLSVPKLNLQVPIVWTKDPKDFEVDLTKGVVHYPGTAMPGEQGTVYISGHSSDYPWKKHPYKQVFARLNALEPGDDVFVDIYGIDGKLYNYRYQVVSENIYRPDDQTQFVDNSAAKLNLSTCWPIGTAKDRLVVTAILQSL
ncbi:MAG: hypothetical protein A2720_01565 [Candidatus Doudnabacteria bacterium RIFCSPHIGHO2_01_FULL_46_24]|uniref:Sortase n=1 Tax=Candidatus Doudnabacteria bacterium RIFCSPHIGHO2_01_FULL_46_24 TaxID=1817825 RepID=A0A1F5NU64_9BACT|nr:MAG: hypothetical protein A2720_01565 [Candidatus Doudnabacteria bacterium RIFCSPHIGHO2_01_FULL_46_24]